MGPSRFLMPPPASSTWRKTCPKAPARSQTSSSRSRSIAVLQQLDREDNVVVEKHIVPGQELFIGRDRQKCQMHIDNPHVSARHLRIYTITYDNDGPNDVDTLVYAEDLSRNGTFWHGALIGKGRGGFLLSEDDLLKLSGDVRLRFKLRQPRKEHSHFDDTQENEMEKFKHAYIVTDRLLGAGAFGRVFMAVEQTTRTQLACKIVDLRPLQQRMRFGKIEEPLPADGIDLSGQVRKVRMWGEKQKPENQLMEKLKTYYREAEILANIRHPNIIGLEKVIITEDTIYMFEDLVTGGDLFSYIESKNGKLTEVEAAVIIRQITLALAFLHEQNIVHRDLKPDNILMTELSTGCRVVLTDFGAARKISSPLSRMLSMAGTDEYAAPEVHGDTNSNVAGYTKAVDLWSLGCVSAILLTGLSAFAHPKTRLFSKSLALEGNLESLRSSREWQAVRERPKDFVEKLLVMEEDQRLTADAALNHSWFCNDFHRADFSELYKRSVKHWVPRPSKKDLIQFHGARNYRRLAEDEGVLGKRNRGFSGGGKQDMAVEAHCQPFPRKMHATLWPPKKKHSSYVSEETRVLIQEKWPSPQKLGAARSDEISPQPKRRKFLSSPDALPKSRTPPDNHGASPKFDAKRLLNYPTPSIAAPRSPVLPVTPERGPRTLSNTSMPLRPVASNAKRATRHVNSTPPGETPPIFKKPPAPSKAGIIIAAGENPASSGLSVPRPRSPFSLASTSIYARAGAPGSASPLKPRTPRSVSNTGLRRRTMSKLSATEPSSSPTTLSSRRRNSVFDIYDDRVTSHQEVTDAQSPTPVSSHAQQDHVVDTGTVAHHISAIVSPADVADP